MLVSPLKIPTPRTFATWSRERRVTWVDRKFSDVIYELQQEDAVLRFVERQAEMNRLSRLHGGTADQAMNMLSFQWAANAWSQAAGLPFVTAPRDGHVVGAIACPCWVEWDHGAGHFRIEAFPRGLWLPGVGISLAEDPRLPRRLCATVGPDGPVRHWRMPLEECEAHVAAYFETDVSEIREYEAGDREPEAFWNRGVEDFV